MIEKGVKLLSLKKYEVEWSNSSLYKLVLQYDKKKYKVMETFDESGLSSELILYALEPHLKGSGTHGGLRHSGERMVMYKMVMYKMTEKDREIKFTEAELKYKPIVDFVSNFTRENRDIYLKLDKDTQDRFGDFVNII